MRISLLNSLSCRLDPSGIHRGPEVWRELAACAPPQTLLHPRFASMGPDKATSELYIYQGIGGMSNFEEGGFLFDLLGLFPKSSLTLDFGDRFRAAPAPRLEEN